MYLTWDTIIAVFYLPGVSMARTAMIRARLEPTLKTNAEKILRQLGMSSTEAITLFYTQVTLRKGLPFDVKLPNQTTLDTFKKTDQDLELNEYDNLDEFMRKINEE
jgi:DNA-damage-inducible protein J